MSARRISGHFRDKSFQATHALVLTTQTNRRKYTRNTKQSGHR